MNPADPRWRAMNPEVTNWNHHLGGWGLLGSLAALLALTALVVWALSFGSWSAWWSWWIDVNS